MGFLPEAGITKAMNFRPISTIREMVFATARTLTETGTQEVLDVINYNFRFNPENQMTPLREDVEYPFDRSEAFWLKKNQTLEYYQFPIGVNLCFERASDLNSKVEKAQAAKDSRRTTTTLDQALNLSAENEKVKFLTKGRFTRDQAAREIVTTERTYVEQLETLQQEFVNPTHQKGIIESSNLKMMFSNARQILKVHKKMLQSMEERIDNWSAATELGDILLQLEGNLKLYGDYCLSYERNLAELESLSQSNPELQAWIKECEEKDSMPLNSIGAYLIVPVQRIPRYRLLFEQLLKLTPKSHNDHASLTETLEIVNRVATYVNNYRNLEEELRQLMNERIGDMPIPKLAEGRILLKEGVLKKTSSRAVQERKVFLFNDLLLYCGPKKEPFPYKGHVYIDSGSWIKGLEEGKLKNAFQIVGGSKTYTFQASSPQEKHAWIQAISGALAEQAEKNTEGEKNQVKVHDRGGIWRMFLRTDKLGF